MTEDDGNADENFKLRVNGGKSINNKMTIPMSKLEWQ